MSIKFTDVDADFTLAILNAVQDAKPGERPVLHEYETWDSDDTRHKIDEIKAVLAIVNGWAVGRIDNRRGGTLVATPDEQSKGNYVRIIVPSRSPSELRHWWLANLEEAKKEQEHEDSAD